MPSSFHIKRFDLGDMDGESSESSDGVGDAEFPRSTTARMATNFDPLLSGASDDFAVAASSDDFDFDFFFFFALRSSSASRAASSLARRRSRFRRFFSFLAASSSTASSDSSFLRFVFIIFFFFFFSVEPFATSALSCETPFCFFRRRRDVLRLWILTTRLGVPLDLARALLQHGV